MQNHDDISKYYTVVVSSGDYFRIRAAVEDASMHLHTAYDSNVASMLEPAMEQLEDGPEVELDVLCASIEDALGSGVLPSSKVVPLTRALETLRTGRTPRLLIPKTVLKPRIS